MFNFFKKKNQLTAPMSGTLLPLSQVGDPVFASKAMGDGFAVEPTEGIVYAPVTGKVTSIFPTKHAFGLVDEKGNEILVHIGIDTVSLQGEGFEVFVSEGETVNATTKLATVDLSVLKAQQKPATTMVIFTNQPALELNIVKSDVTAQAEVLAY
ncbi:PTS sugar transporter subunit IIA [Enterococcus canintestini]|uniref:Sugar permease n=1 Tax=Enterococcus canintestini TaxID=317010 RepID=A0A267HPP3_9ENTE|nr:PTS glucose transporter subunit IIA [Enterococcus canintestini]PAB00339.1 sugar permease [Enterococcus canintestini]